LGFVGDFFVLLSSNPLRVGIPFFKTPLPLCVFPTRYIWKKENLKQFFRFSKAHGLKLYPAQTSQDLGRTGSCFLRQELKTLYIQGWKSIHSKYKAC
jgi:hypothetical protein